MKAIKAGNFVVNSLDSGAAIISADLKTALTEIRFPMAKNQHTHDVQIMKDGSVLFFNNEKVRGDEKLSGPRSSIEIIDPITKKPTLEFTATPPEMFYSMFAGGVQQVNDNILLFSHISSAYYYFDRRQKRVIHSGVLKDSPSVPNFRWVQQVRAENVSEFLKYW